jgi:3-hydroxyacyl-CoA dehydrogenase
VEQAPARLERLAQNLAAKSLLGSSSSRDTLRRIEPNIDMAAAARAPLSSNACQRIWNLKKACSSNWGGIAIYVTNTSTLVPSQLAGSCRHQSGWRHSISTCPSHSATSSTSCLIQAPTRRWLPLSMPFAREIGQIPIHYKQEYHGYIFNSIFGAMRQQALDLAIEGVASFEDIDRSWMGIFKMPIGPFEMFDQIGLDTIAEILDHWAETLNDDARRRRVEYLKTWTAQGFLGAKSHRGFYRYPSPTYVGSGFLSEGKVSSNSVPLTDSAQ